MTQPEKIFVAGHRGMVGSALVRGLIAAGHPPELILTRSHSELDLTEQSAVRNFLCQTKPDKVYLAAAKVGGIHANNTYPAEFIYQNLMIECNVIQGAFCAGVKKLLFLGSSCIYPRTVPQPMAEEALLSSGLEPTNEPYAIAKIAGIKLCESYNRQYGQTDDIDYRSVMPTNLYGPGDNYHPENSHVIPALIRRFHEAKTRGLREVTIWGTGTPRREFLYVDDLAEASIHVMELNRHDYARYTTPMRSHLNVGWGSDITIAELASQVAGAVGYQGSITFDPTRPDGPPRKLMDSSRLRASGWSPKTDLKSGLTMAYQDFLKASDE